MFEHGFRPFMYNVLKQIKYKEREPSLRPKLPPSLTKTTTYSTPTTTFYLCHSPTLTPTSAKLFPATNPSHNNRPFSHSPPPAQTPPPPSQTPPPFPNPPNLPSLPKHYPKKPHPHLQKKVAKKNPHGEKVAIAPPPMGASRRGGKSRLLLFLYVEAFFATFFSLWGGGLFHHVRGLFTVWGPFLTL